MYNKFKTILLTVAAAGFVFSSTASFARPGGGDDVFPGTTESCEQLWLVNDEGNADLLPNEGGECIDVPAHLKKVKVLFNLDNAVTKTSPSVVYETNDDGSYVKVDGERVKEYWGVDDAPKTELIGTPKFVMVTDPVGLRHMALLGKVMQYRIAEKGLDPNDVAIVGIFHGEAMSVKKWPFKSNTDPQVTFWINKILDLQAAGMNIQLEVCGVTLKGMQKKAKELEKYNPRTELNDLWKYTDERAVYGYDVASDNGGKRRILVNQGAIARIIDLQKDDFAYIQEE